MKSEKIQDLIENLIFWALQHYWIKRIWSFLPSRCVFRGLPEDERCEDRYLRWTETPVTIYGDPPEDVWVCKDCLNKMRQISFKAGHSVEHLPDGTVRYSPSVSSPQPEGECKPVK